MCINKIKSVNPIMNAPEKEKEHHSEEPLTIFKFLFSKYLISSTQFCSITYPL